MNRNSPLARPSAVYVFGTCIVDLFFPTAGMSAIKLLEREGIRVMYPQAQSCCGQPAYSSGFREEARTVALSQIDAFAGDEPIVVLSGSCAGMMKHHYPTLFKDHPREAEVLKFSARIYEFTRFLVDVLQIDLQDMGEPVEVALHTSCAARREMNVRDSSLQLLDKLHNVTLLTHDHESECCGFGGTFSVKHPDISAAMVCDKTAALKATGASQVVSADCACLLNINGALTKQASPLRGKHLADFIWTRTTGEPS